MKYELRELHEIVFIYLKPGYFIVQANRESLLDNLHDVISIETERISDSFMEAIFSAADVEQKNDYVSRHQEDLVAMLDRMGDYLNHELAEGLMQNDAGVFEREYRKINLLLLKLYGLMYRRGRKFWNNQGKIPELFKRLNVKKIKAFKVTAEKKLIRRPVKNGFRELLMLPLDSFLNERRTNFYDYRYVLRYRNVLRMEISKARFSYQSITQFLVMMNMNAPQFGNLYTSRLTSIFSNSVTLRRALNYYQQHLKMLKQTTVEEKRRYSPALPSARQQLANWLQEEIYFLQLKFSPSADSTDSGSKPGHSKKVRLNMSAEGIAFWLRLAKEANIILYEDLTDAIEVVAKTFSSVKKEDLAEKTMRNNYYTIERRTLRKVKDQLIGMINKANTY